MMGIIMNREVKKVPLDFDWKQHKVWKGYLNPYYVECDKCEGGYSKAGLMIDKIMKIMFYTDKENLTETQLKILNFLSDTNFSKEEVNMFSWCGTATYNALLKFGEFVGLEDKWHICKECNGDCVKKEIKKKYETWKEYEPPKGEGYQLWETISEGSPISPVCQTFDELCEWLADNPYGITEKFIKEDWINALKSSCPLIEVGTNKLITLEKEVMNVKTKEDNMDATKMICKKRRG